MVVPWLNEPKFFITTTISRVESRKNVWKNFGKNYFFRKNINYLYILGHAERFEKIPGNFSVIRFFRKNFNSNGCMEKNLSILESGEP